MSLQFCSPLTPCLADDIGKGADPALVERIDALLADKTLQTGFQGILIQSLKDHSTLYERNADKVFLPASNNKLLTSGAALSLMGPDYVYNTKIVAGTAPDKRGVLHADLSLVGSGDPVLSAADLTALAHALRTAGLKRIEGAVTANDSLFDQQRLGDGWTWDDEPYYYSAQVSALNLNENLVSVRVFPGKKEGDPVRVVVIPTDRYMTVQNAATTAAAKSKSSISVERMRGQNILVIGGTVALDTPEDAAPKVTLTVENPTQFALTTFREALGKEGIRIGNKRFPASAGTVTLAEHKSVPLSEMLKLLNKPSDNLIAECLLKTVGAFKKGTGTAGSDGTGAQTARTFFTSIGMDVTHLNQADGSGLSRFNFVSPRDFVQLLTYLHDQPTFPVLYDSLPIAGVDGSLRNRLKNTPAANNCHAKTGYISHASSLSGYVTTKGGDMLVFSMLMNNHLSTNALPVSIQDKIVLLLADYTHGGGAHAQ
ncbi:MAG: D-alanyl-D-alanine carboxypeptidase serine-type,PBP4 family [Chthonomonadaceae bacterium]|nr:D-alanyl-D-alanine carboxypeptidase serine-type,PBP4 family [Chthonomonadaceae bacterium]